MWSFIRSRLFVPLRDVRPPPLQPFGEKFGFTLFRDFLVTAEIEKFGNYVSNVNSAGGGWKSDNRTRLPGIPQTDLGECVERIEEENIVFRDYLNHQSVNLFQRGNYLRPHIDNLFCFDETVVVMNFGAPAMLKFVHLQNGEELEIVIPDKSLYVMEGACRYIYMHMVLPVEYNRVSIVLRRSILRSDGHFGKGALNLPPQTRDMIGHQARELEDAIFQKRIGVPRIDVNEQWMQEQNLGAFETGEMVKRLRPLRDWSLRSQVEEDEIRFEELVTHKHIDLKQPGNDLRWRFQEVQSKISEIEQEITLNREALSEAAAENKKHIQMAREIRASQAPTNQ